MFFRSRNSSAPAKGKATRKETPFEARRREIAELEAKLKAEAERAERFIKVAPKIAADRQKEQREAYLTNAISPGNRSGLRLPDSRHIAAEAASLPRLRRRDRREGKWVFFMLILGLIAAAWWAWQTLFQSAF
jgi:hypothetical protein